MVKWLKKEKKKKKMKDKKIKTINKILKELFELLEVKIEFEVEKKEDIYLVKIKTEEAGILIGSHGQTLQSLKHFLALALFKKLDEWVNLVVDVNDYWQKREQDLKEIADKTAERAIATGSPTPLPFLNSAERRIIHLALSSHPQVVSESEGEGRERRIVIKPRA
ncbi:KH domain-containing protein [Candidatus Microgenomates bacterium]|nr:KH domain-containing protein [Candidatus Microgenomates bacterium]